MRKIIENTPAPWEEEKKEPEVKKVKKTDKEPVKEKETE